MRSKNAADNKDSEDQTKTPKIPVEDEDDEWDAGYNNHELYDERMP